MNIFSRQIFPNPGEVMWAAAEKMLKLAVRTVEEKGRFSVALSGGSTPKGMYDLLADPEHGFRDRMPWSKMHFFWSDERYVPADDSQSNYKMAWDHLLTKVNVPTENIHRFRTELASPEATAEDYQQQLESFFSVSKQSSPPRFDLVLLGMGPDGHTASLFPGIPLLHSTGHWIKSFWVASQRSHRLTMMPDLINEADAVFLLVTGSEKAEVVALVLTDEPKNASLPVQHIHPTHGSLCWLLDEAAAARVVRESA